MEQSTENTPEQAAITRSERINNAMTRIVLCSAVLAFAALFAALARPDQMVFTWAFLGALCPFVWSMGLYLFWVVNEPMTRGR